MYTKVVDFFKSVGQIFSSSQNISKRSFSEFTNGDDESDDIMILEEPPMKRIKNSESRGGSISTRLILNNLKTHETSSVRETDGTFSKYMPEVGNTRRDHHFDILKSNKENMSIPKDPLFKNVVYKSPTKASSYFPGAKGSAELSSPIIDSNFRFSPSFSSTLERPSPLGIKRRDSLNSSRNVDVNAKLRKQQLYSGIKKSPCIKKVQKPATNSISKFLRNSSLFKSPTIKDSYRINEKMAYKKMLDREMSNNSAFTPLTIFRKNTFLSSKELSEKAVKSDALLLKRIGSSSLLNKCSDGKVKDSSKFDFTETQTASLNFIRDILKRSPSRDSIDLVSKDGSSSSRKLSLQESTSSKKEESVSFDDIVITKEIIKSPSRCKKTLNPLEMSFTKSRFYSDFDSSSIPLNKENQKRLDEQKAGLAKKTAERDEKLRKQTSESKLNDVSDRLKNLTFTYPTIYKEITLEEEDEALPELTPEMIAVIDKAFRGGPAQQVLAERFNIKITRKDIHTLSGLNWLNDEIINYFMNLIVERGGKKNLPKVYAFNTFFYPNLIKSGYSSVRRWTRKVDLFVHDILLVPVHLGMHWCLATIDLRDQTIRYYDSMSGNNHRCIQALLQYLEKEHLDKKKSEYETSEWNTIIVKDIPQQMNGSDCGMFSCMFAEYISRNAKISFTQENMPYFRKRVVYEIVSQKLLK